MLTMKILRDQLPELGEKRTEIPTVDETQGHTLPKTPREGVVVYVNREHCWYTVQFADGVRESYRLPHVRPVGGGGNV
jgi:hypothetical protein